MDDFIHQANLTRFRALLERATDEVQRAQLLRLISEEEAKVIPPPTTPLK
jgi:hypothetical protein